MASDAKRRAAKIVVMLIDDWWTKAVDLKQPEDPGQPLEVRVELLRLKETFERVEKAEDAPKPDGWTEGSPKVAECSCNACVDRRVKEKKERGELEEIEEP